MFIDHMKQRWSPCVYRSSNAGINLQDEAGSTQLHALGRVEAKEGEQSLAVQFYLTDDSQAGDPTGVQR